MEITVHLQPVHIDALRSKLEDSELGQSDLNASDQVRLRRCLKSNNWDVQSLKNLLDVAPSFSSAHVLLEGASIDLPKPDEPKPRNPELEERIQRIKRHLENEEYRKMTEDVDCGQRQSNPRTNPDSFGKELRGMNQQLTMVLNTVLTVGSCFFFVFKGVGYLMPEFKDGPAPILVAVVAAFVVFLADLYFIAKSIT